MTLPRRLAFVNSLIAILALPLPALEWKTTRLKVDAAPLQRTAETAFEFTNTSNRTVTIQRVDTSCDCLEATPSSQTIAPGARGEIKARFNIGDRVGQYERTILVTTDEAGEPATLIAELFVPEVATVSPRSHSWKIGSPASPREVEIIISEGVEITFTEAQSTSSVFQHRLETIEPGRRYRLHLVPQSTERVANAAIRLHGKASTGQDVVFSAYCNIR